ncbi:MAG: putative replicase protein [Etongtovirus faecivicinum]|uniref:RNA-directed RNA polymerase n=1 Tax=Leviviridae sp. TaxID=2027243 RepID=A0ABY3SRZ4_9VIRU|nr:MAG: putative replicase protein [Leviviridae sp.]
MSRSQVRKGSNLSYASNSITSDFIDDLSSTLDSLELSFKTTYLKSEWLRKYHSPDGDTPEVRAERAIRKWLATEDRNKRTNQRLITDVTTIQGVSSDVYIAKARDFIDDLLQGVDPGETTFCRFSHGATTSKGRREADAASKFRNEAHITQSAMGWHTEKWPLLAGEIPVATIKGNVMFTVPKSADIDRVCCKEPDLNMYYQLGVGGLIRRSLMKAGINLNDQRINASLAKQASITGELATVDLSSASDSITTMIVSRLLPANWFVVMDNLRSRYTSIDGKWHENAMFSSMGNGFTFELESLIFWALARSVCYLQGIRGRISVYGDDIIIPSSAVKCLTQVFGFCGFQVNTQKTHVNTGFNESCGAHYYHGIDVKPFYLRRPFRDVTDLINQLNHLRRWSAVDGVCDPRVYSVWLRWARKVPHTLWRGYDLEDPGKLVSLGGPIKGESRALHRSIDKTQKDFSSYLVWHNDKERAPESVVETVHSVKANLILRRVSPWYRDLYVGHLSQIPAFPQELC